MKKTPLFYLIPKFLTKEECLELIADHSDFKSANQNYPVWYRNNERIVSDNRNLAETLFKKAFENIPDTQTDNQQRKWTKTGINPRIRICRYLEGQYFHRHLDGIHHANDNTRSFLTFMIYLNGNDEFTGGRTLFYADKSSSEIIAEYAPQQGDLIIFDHTLWHEGEKVTGGIKYVLRSDILYQTNPLTESKGHRGYIWTIEPHEDFFLTGGRDANICVWNKSREFQFKFKAHTQSVLDICSLPDNQLASCSRDETIKIWNISSQEATLKSTIHIPGNNWLTLCYLPSQNTLMGAGSDGKIYLTSLGSEKILSFQAHKNWIWELAFDASERLYSCSDDHFVKCWELNSMKCIFEIQLSESITAITSYKDKIYAGSLSGKLYILDLSLKLETEIQVHTEKINRIRVLENDILTCSDDRTVKRTLQNISTTLLEHQDFVSNLILIDSEIISVSYDSCLLVSPLNR
jgi:hypothetical protein